MASGSAVNLVPKYRAGMSYSMYKKELQLWKITTKVDKDKQAGHVVLYSLPETDDSRIREKVLRDVSMEDLQKETGLDILIKFLDKHLAKDALAESWVYYREYESYKRNSGESMLQYVNNFDHKYKEVENSSGIQIPQFLLACKVIHNAGLSEDETMIVMTAVDVTKKDDMYEDAKRSLLKFKGGFMTQKTSSGTSENSMHIKQEVLIAEDDDQKYEEAYMAGYHNARGYRGGTARGVMRGYTGMQNYRGQSGRGGQQRGNFRGNYNYGWNQNRGGQTSMNWRSQAESQAPRYQKPQNSSGIQRPLNPPGYNGEPIVCKNCQSYRHITRDCKSNNQSINPPDVNGQPLKCVSCGSHQHFMKDCTESWEYINNQTSKINLCDYQMGEESPYSDDFNFYDPADNQFAGQF